MLKNSLEDASSLVGKLETFKSTLSEKEGEILNAVLKVYANAVVSEDNLKLVVGEDEGFLKEVNEAKNSLGQVHASFTPATTITTVTPETTAVTVTTVTTALATSRYLCDK